MNKSDLNKISNLIVFTKKIISELDDSITKGSINYNISRWIADGTIITLKRGLYITAENYNRYKSDNNFLIYLANTIRFPSYVTSTSILSNYNMLTEATYGMTSFSLKLTRTYNNKIASFKYSKVKPSLYTGYLTDYFLTKKIYYASKAKALFDFLYTRSSILPDDLKEINLVEELRFNLDTMSKEDFSELKTYRDLEPNTKLSRIINNLIEYAPNIKYTKFN